MKILLWQTAYLGDVVLATPLIQTLLKNFKDSHLAFVGRPFILELLKGYPVEPIPYDKRLTSTFELLKKIRGFDVAVSMHRSMRSALLLFLSGIKMRIGFDRSELPFLYTHRVKHRWGMHEVDRNLELLRPLGIKEFVRETKLYVDDEERELVKNRFNLPRDFVVVSPFSNFALKEWHMEGWKGVIKGLSTPVVLVGTPERLKDSQSFEGVVNLVGKTSLRELLAVLSLSKLVLSCDSSPMHMANALGVPAICVYTATSPHYGFYPLLGSYLTPNLPCSPCSPNPKRCKTSTFECLRAIKPDEVLRQASTFLKVQDFPPSSGKHKSPS